MELKVIQVYGETSMAASDTLNLTAGQWVQIRHGNPDNPVVDLQEVCPVGKKRTIRIAIEVIEGLA